MDNTKKFTGKAEVYDKYRPDYPAACFEFMAEECGLRAGDWIADIGAGTGIFTRRLAERGFRVTAIEPNADMRAAAEENLTGYEGVTVSAGSAEATGLPAQSVDCVTAAQAFHWFDTEKFRAECRRILKPGGRAVLVWNHRVPDAPQNVDTAEVFRQWCPAFTGFSGGTEFFKKADDAFSRFFQAGSMRHAVFAHDLEFCEEAFVGRGLSSSYAPKPGDEAYPAVCAALRQVFARHQKGGIIRVPNAVNCYVGLV